MNSRPANVTSVKCHPSAIDIGERVDVAFLAVPASAIAAAVEDCAKAGVIVAIVGAAGFAEVGSEGAQRQAELKALSLKYGIRIVGPNCNGIYSPLAKAALGFNTAHSRIIPPGNIGIVSHTGALFDTMIHNFDRLGVGLSFFVSAGNEVDLDVLDYFEFLASDDTTKVIALVIDAITDSARFRSLVHQARNRSKCVVVLKIGTSDAGAVAAEAHSSRMAGSASAYFAMFEACGVPCVTSLESLAASVALLSRYGNLRGGLAAFSCSGAGASMLLDMCGRIGIELGRLETAKRQVSDFQAFSEMKIR